MTLARLFRGTTGALFLTILIATGCAQTEIIESPRTGYVPEGGEAKEPSVVWTSRSLSSEFDYLGTVKVRSWTYDGALERLIEGGKELRADAIVDIHFEREGFLKKMQAFAIKFR
ncbi:hypothetical protein K2X33_12825 [bacterium]|nr:hypothetical protein [bacterium]